ncbi:hypothetical protein Gotri_005117, partial [Gossypium trilobum]|nr:hypothetical protein [Gossypium trilobum]
MASEFGESASHSPQNPSCSSNNGNGDAGNFECNICFELAQDPIVTLCGHLFCWPCLYKWLHIHSRSRECPICKALIEEEQLVPLYGRGKSSTDPRSKSIPGVNIPNRPAGQRPETAPPPEPNQFPQNGFGFMGGLGGFAPMATARFGNFTLSAAFGGLIPSLFNLQVHGFPDAAMFGHAAGFPYGFSNLYHGGHAHGYHHHHHHHHHHHRTAQGQQDHYLKMLFLFIIVVDIVPLRDLCLSLLVPCIATIEWVIGRFVFLRRMSCVCCTDLVQLYMVVTADMPFLIARLGISYAWGPWGIQGQALRGMEWVKGKDASMPPCGV